MQTPPTLAWRDSALELIDQRALPHQVRYLRCLDAPAVADAIRSMVVRGAPAIGCAAAYGMALAACAAVRSGDELSRALSTAAAHLRCSIQ